MAKLIVSLVGKVSAALVKWALVAALWIGSVVFVTTNALALDAIADAMMRFAGIPTPHLEQKQQVAKAKKDLKAQRNQTARETKRLNEERALRKRAIKSHSAKVSQLTSKMALRNVTDAGQSLIPVVGGLISIPLAAADVYAACEMVDMQNDLNTAFDLNSELSDMESVCVNAVNEIEELERVAEEKLVQMKQTTQQVSETVVEWKEQIPSGSELTDQLANQMCRFAGQC